MTNLIFSYKHTIVEYGSKTLSGYGGISLPAGATTISNNGNTNLTISSGFVVPLSNGVNSGIVTFDNGVTWEVRTISNAYSVRRQVEILVTLRHPELTYGDQVLLRGGTYDDTEQNLGSDRIRRDALPLGSFVTPTRYGAQNMAGWYRGYDLDTGNYIVVKPHKDIPFVDITTENGRTRPINNKTDDTPILGNLIIDGNNGFLRGIRFHKLRFAGRKSISFRSTCPDMAVDRCHFENENPIPIWDTWSGAVPPEFAVQRVQILNGNCDNIHVVDNLMEGGDAGVYMANTNHGYSIVGNWVRGMWNDSFKIGGGNNGFVAWNISTDKYNGPTESGYHADHFQWLAYHPGTFVLGNIAWRGTGYTGRTDGQGIFLDDVTTAIPDVTIVGNVSANAMYRGTSLYFADDPTIYGNMALRHPESTTNVAVSWQDYPENSGGWMVNNVGEGVVVSSTAIASGNITLAPTNYTDAFVNPDFYLDPWTNLAGVLSGFATKTSGPLDISPARNPFDASWINYATRTFDNSVLTR